MTGGQSVSIGQTMISSKKDNESYAEYQQRVLDTKSKSFCGAKWYNATIWLGSGQTTSCHHPLPHAIDLEAIKTNPSAIHNTVEKKQQRAEMQQGIRPSGCEYCWKLEDAGTTSDRPHKSKIFSEKELQEAFEMPVETDVNLRTLEISFDRTCQFACTYCNPAFSTTWAKDIKDAGPYGNLVTDGRGHYSHSHEGSQRYKFNEVNPYAEAFFQWWDQGLYRDLRELRITGGEPLMSGYTWKLLDWFRENNSDCTLAINTNLGFDDKKMDEFLKKIKSVPHLEIYTSCESVNERAEYIRDGLHYKQWEWNLKRLIESKHVKAVHVMCTISALSLINLPAFLSSLVSLKSVYGKNAVSFTLNILRFPSFQSPVILPDDIKETISAQLEDVITYARMFAVGDNDYLHDMEIEHIMRLIQYIATVETPHDGASPVEELKKDFKRFHQQFDVRRNKNFTNTFPELKGWYNDIQL